MQCGFCTRTAPIRISRPFARSRLPVVAAAAAVALHQDAAVLPEPIRPQQLVALPVAAVAGAVVDAAARRSRTSPGCHPLSLAVPPYIRCTPQPASDTVKGMPETRTATRRKAGCP